MHLIMKNNTRYCILHELLNTYEKVLQYFLVSYIYYKDFILTKEITRQEKVLKDNALVITYDIY